MKEVTKRVSAASEAEQPIIRGHKAEKSCPVEFPGPADATVPSSAETLSRTPSTIGEGKVATDELLSTDALKSATTNAVSSHTITASDFAEKTAAYNGERSGEQSVTIVRNPSKKTELSVADFVNPVVQTQREQTSPNLSQQDVTLLSTLQGQGEKGISPNKFGGTSQPSIFSQERERSQTAARFNLPTSASQSLAHGNKKMSVEEISHPATVSQLQQTSNISAEVSPSNSPMTSGFENPTTSHAIINSLQSVVGPDLLEKESSQRKNLQQHPILSNQVENSLLPISTDTVVHRSVLPTESPIKPAITVEEVVPLTLLTNQQSTSSGLRKEPPQEMTHPTNAASQQVVFGVGGDKGTKVHLGSNPKKLGETSVLSGSNSDNKQTNAVKMTEDKGGGNSASSIEEDYVLTMKQLHSLEEIRQYSLNYLSNIIYNEMKQYRNYVLTAWESEKLVSWTVEATNYLKDYMDAISISKSANNSVCVENDLKNYETRSKTLQDIIELCRTEVKRETWRNTLQEKTSNILLPLHKIFQNDSNIIAMLNNESGLFEVIKRAVEDCSRNSLCPIDNQSIRKSFSKIKELSLGTDKEEYLKCIDSKPEQSMIKDTMSDIMRIKNNCVG